MGLPRPGQGLAGLPPGLRQAGKGGQRLPFSIEIEFTQAGAKDLAEINQAVKDSAEYLTATASSCEVAA